MRKLWWLLALCGCASTGTSRTVQRATTPLGHFSPVMLRVTPLVPAAQEAVELEAVVAARLRSTCGWQEVFTASSTPEAPAALLVDARIALLERVDSSDRAMLGAMAGQARMVVAVDFIDLKTQQRIGAAEVEGTSSGGSTLAGGTDEAMERVVEKMVEVMRQEGCTTRTKTQTAGGGTVGAEPPPAATLTPAVQAEALNQEGKDLYKAKDFKGAVTKFEAAIAIAPEARYYFNVCAAHDQLGSLDAALAACGEVLNKSPTDELKTKAEKRIEAIRAKKK
jgi:tetratricopeptide (TPR) repeat protein